MNMPYKNPEKQKEVMRKIMSSRYKKIRLSDVFEGQNFLLISWMKLCKKDAETEVRLVKIDPYEFVLPITSLDSFIQTLKRHDFPDNVKVWSKKFLLKCVDVEDDSGRLTQKEGVEEGQSSSTSSKEVKT